jgi:hypothetical protein
VLNERDGQKATDRKQEQYLVGAQAERIDPLTSSVSAPAAGRTALREFPPGAIRRHPRLSTAADAGHRPVPEDRAGDRSLVGD